MSQDEKELGRREFLKLAGLTAAGAAVAGCSHEDPFHLVKPEVPGSNNFAQGAEQWIASACGQCEAACGVRVRVVEGRAVKVSGNPESPINAGGIGPRGQAGPQVLYDPDRVPGPMRRKVPRGVAAEGPDAWEPVAWEDAIEQLGEHLVALREDEHGDRLCIVTGQERGMTRDLLARFARAFGTNHFLDGFSKGMAPALMANQLMQGIDEAPVYDWGNARLVVSLGAEVLQASCQKVHFARTSTSDRGRARIVHVGAARTTTALQADDFYQIRSGTFGAFALGLAHVIVAAELHDAEFLADHCTGFEPWLDGAGATQPGLRALLDEYTSANVGEICGLEPVWIEQLGKELGTTRPAFVIAGTEAYQASNGIAAAMAVQALNAVIGSIDRPGGVQTQRPAPVAAWDDLEADEYAEVSLEVAPIWTGLPGAPLALELVGVPIDLLPVALLAAEPGRINTLFLHYTNPLWSRPEAARWREALARVPLVVSFSPYWDETCLEQADWILPDHTYLERWEDAGPSPGVGHPVFSLRQPVVEPLHDSMQTTDVLLGLARAIGEGVAEALGWKDSKTIVKDRIFGIYKAKSGSIVESKSSAFLAAFYAAGGWYDRTYTFEDWANVLRTDSGRFEFAPTRLYELLVGAKRADAASACLPHHEALVAEGDPKDFPLLLVPYKPPTYPEGGGANLPLLQELRLRTTDTPWKTQVDLNPRTAQDFGVTDGDRVTVTSPVGKLSAYARLDEGVHLGELRVPKGHGHTAMGRFAAGWGGNANELVSLASADSIFGLTPWVGTRVAIQKEQA